MSILPIGFDQSPQGLERSRGRLDKPPSHAITGQQSDDPNDDAIGRAGFAKSTSELNRLNALADRAQTVAASIRTIDRTMEKVSTTVDTMKKELEGITKTYPPYPLDSEERVKRLKSYAGLRTMIDRLTIPPDDTVRNTSHRKEFESILSNDYTFVIEQNGMTKTVLKEDVHYGPTGLNIPQLASPEATDDRAIEQALQQLDNTGDTIQARREALKAQAVAIGGSMYGTLLNDQSAEATSMLVRQDLATQPVGIAHENTAQLDQLLG